VLIDFWTYTCINCIRTLPRVTAWDRAYRKDGLTVVGVHSPEFSFEKETPNVERAVEQDGIAYPVAQDNQLATWNAWSNEYWPAEYLIDARGHVRYASFGEGDYAKTEAAIRSLLVAAGATDLGGDARPARTYDPAAQETPETYVGLARAERFLPSKSVPGTHAYPAFAGRLPLNDFSLGGTWTLTQESATAGAGATLTGRVQGKDAYLVLSPPAHGAGTLRIAVDGRPTTTLRITSQRLYHLLSRPRIETHTITLRPSPGVAAFAFTFG
jgi:thiol-disulfide isomerase/thioredoxin